MRTLEQAGDLKGKKVFLRIDLDVPVGKDGIIEEEFRIVRQRENLQKLLSAGARVIMGAHISAVSSLEPLLPQLQRMLGGQMLFCRDFDAAQEFLAGQGTLALLENLRTNPGEEDNSESFAGSLVAGCDLYVNNAFAVCHREHASVATAPMIVPSYAGLLVVEECAHLRAVIEAPAVGKVIYMGGAKASTKVPVIRHLIDQAEMIAVGGVVANDILKEKGVDVAQSRVDEDAHELLAGLDLNDSRLVVPTDHVTSDGQILDLGPNSAAAFAALARDAKLIIWNGPMGKFEDDRYIAGTRAVAQAIADSSAQKVIGGGDTVSAVDKLGLLDTMGFVSTGGGAMLAFLAGQQLPGLKALGYYDEKSQR
jgi:phosphoglycerate kinase